MRIWDVSPGYLNRQSLLGEHRELHGLYNILIQGKRGYSRHPETLRWVGASDALAWRHALLGAEMRLRGYVDRSPLPLQSGKVKWPESFVTEPADQFALLHDKYADKAEGRIPLPLNAQQLWAQHKYSIMARDPEAYRDLGRAVARLRRRDAMHELARTLVVALRKPPPKGRLVNALEHIWGHVRIAANSEDKKAALRDPSELLRRIQILAIRHREPFLLASTALGELAPYLKMADGAFCHDGCEASGACSL